MIFWRMSPSRFLNLAICLVAALLCVGGAGASTTCAMDRAVFFGKDGTVSFRIEIADDEAERAQGLMFRKKLSAHHGMLFIYDTPREVAFWMRNTLIPLDLIFLDERGVVRHIHHNARPLDETPIPGSKAQDPDPERLMVLEISGGDAERLGIEPGQSMAHPRLDQTKAARPCN